MAEMSFLCRKVGLTLRDKELRLQEGAPSGVITPWKWFTSD